MAIAKLNKRTVDALTPPKSGQAFIWDKEIKGFGVRVGATGVKSFVIQYANDEGRLRRLKIGRYGVMTVEEARELAKFKLGTVAAGADPAQERADARKQPTVADLCDWYLVEARAGRMLGRKNRPIKESTLGRDESRIKTHIKPLLGNRVASKLTIADVEQMQDDVKNGKTAKERGLGRGGRVTGGVAAASGCMATIQAILGHAKHKGLLAVHPTKGAKKLAGNKKTRRLSVNEIELLGMALALAERNGENPVALGIVRTLVLTGFRREEAQAMQRSWLSTQGGYVAFPDTKVDAQVRAIGSAAIRIIEAQPVVGGNLHVFPSAVTDGPFRSVADCLTKVCASARIDGVTPHTLRHTFGSMAGELGFSELTIRAMLGHASQNVTQDYIHIDQAVKLAVDQTSEAIAALLDKGAAKLATMCLAA